jgi:hypothetical protein
VLPFWILYNNWSFLLVLLSSNLSQPVSLYRYSVLVKIGSPVIILAASNCNLSNLHELETPQLPRPHMHTQILVECKLSIISLNFFYLIYISIYAKHFPVHYKRLSSTFRSSPKYCPTPLCGPLLRL